MRRFHHFAGIDWSGAVGPLQPGIALAVCSNGQDAPGLVDPPSLHWSRPAIQSWLEAHADQDLLVGVDFSFSLPFADHQAFFPGWSETPPDPRRLWSMVDKTCAEDTHLAATRFVDDPDASRHFRRHGGREGDLFGGGSGRLRLTETVCRVSGFSPQSSFNLVGAAQVGKSSLTGMRMLHRLCGRIPIWPFDPIPKRGAVIVEIYTSIAARAAGVTGGSKIRDHQRLDAALAVLGSHAHVPLRRYTDHSTDAIVTAAWLRSVSTDERLWCPTNLASVSHTEGWTFGVS